MGTPGPVVGDVDLDLLADPPDPDAHALVGRGVLRLVLEQLLEHLAEPRVVADRHVRAGRLLPADRVRAQEEPERLDGLVHGGHRIERRPRQPGQPVAADRHQDRVHLAVEPGELVVGRGPPRLGRGRVGERRGAGRHVGQQVDVDADHRERRPQVVGHDRQQLGAGGVERRQLGQPRLDLGGQPALLDDAGEQRRDRPQEADLLVAEDPRLARLDVEHADHLAVPLERHGEHPGQGLDVEAADPREAVVERHVLHGDRLAARRDPPGDALAPGQADLADLRAVEAVGRGQRQPRGARGRRGRTSTPRRPSRPWSRRRSSASARPSRAPGSRGWRCRGGTPARAGAPRSVSVRWSRPDHRASGRPIAVASPIRPRPAPGR